MFEALTGVSGVRVFRVEARILDGEVAVRFRERSAELVDDGPIVLDLSRVEFADSSGVGCILSLQRAFVERGGTLSLAGLQPRVRSLVELVQLHRVLDVFNDVDEALRTFGCEGEVGSSQGMETS